MAYETGTATDHIDLMNKIIAFAVSGGGWTNLGPAAAGQADGTWLRGPGLSGTENIYAGIKSYSDVNNDTYGLWIRAAQGFLSASAWGGQPGVSPECYSAAWATSMPYWIVANGQRVIAVWKVSTTYHALHFGKIFPYATPSEYGYPFYIGAEDVAVRRWSYQSHNWRHFVDPGGSGTAYLCFPDGAWQAFRNTYDSGGGEGFDNGIPRYVWPYMGALDQAGGGDTVNIIRAMRENIDGSYVLLPLVLHSNAPSRAIWGEIDGAYYVSGAENAAENVITISGQDYLVVQNIYRTSRHHYWALKLA